MDVVVEGCGDEEREREGMLTCVTFKTIGPTSKLDCVAYAHLVAVIVM